jgi:adenylate kinase family enzyme
MAGRVLVITGPGGAGKTTLATAVADHLGWVPLGEDDVWVAHGWRGRRTPEQEAIVQGEVTRALLDAVRRGDGVVLEMILYSLAPNPLTGYREALTAHRVPHATVVLRPSVDEIVRRMAERGRSTDLADLEGRRRDATWQVAVIDAEVQEGRIDPSWVLDPTARSVDDLVDACTARLGCDRHGARRELIDAAALWSTGLAASTDVVDAAVVALVAGIDTPAVVRLAGATRAEADADVPDLLPPALAEIGLVLAPAGATLGARDVLGPDRDVLAAGALARRHLWGALDAVELCRLAHRTFGHDTVPIVEALSILDDRYDTLEYERPAADPAAVAREVTAAARLVAAESDRLTTEA